MVETVEPGTKPRPVVPYLPRLDNGSHSELDAQTQLLADRYGVTIPHARTIIYLLRGGVA